MAAQAVHFAVSAGFGGLDLEEDYEKAGQGCFSYSLVGKRHTG
jgi:hypothetical protein